MNEIYRNWLGPIMWGWGCGFKWTWSCPFQPMCPAGSYYLLSYSYSWHLLFTSHLPPGRRWEQQSHQNVPQEQKCWLPAPEAHLHLDWSCGVGFGQYSLLTCDYSDHRGPLASKSSDMAFSFRGMGAAESSGTSVSMLSSLSSSMTTSESCWRRLSLTMEISLMLSPSNGRGSKPRLGLPSIMEQHLCHSSSFCTWSSQFMEEEWLSSIASLKAVCWALGSSAVLSHEGWGRVGNFQSQGWDELWGDPPHGVWDIACFLLQLCCSFTLRPLLDSLWDWLGFITLGSLLSYSWVLWLGLWEGLQWSPEASVHPYSSSHQCRLFSYWDQLSIPLKKGAQTCAIWSHTP